MQMKTIDRENIREKSITSGDKNTFGYRIVSKTFPYGDDREVIFEIKNVTTGECFKISALQLIQNSSLLEKFSPLDICDIAYTAAWEMFLSEKNLCLKEEICK
jgi:hypothetical protein